MHLDENECEISNGGCQHQCKNNNGSFVCHCNEGFFLDGNGKSCSGKHEINIRVSKQSPLILRTSLLLTRFYEENYSLKIKSNCLHP